MSVLPRPRHDSRTPCCAPPSASSSWHANLFPPSRIDSKLTCFAFAHDDPATQTMQL